MKVNKSIFISGLILIGALSRILPHPPNFTAIASMGLFAGALMGGKYLRFVIPFAALFISDLIINNTIYASFYDGFVLWRPGFLWVYAPMLLMAGFAPFLLKHLNVKTILGSTIAASFVFFIISNLGVWLTDAMYPINFSGLMACYAAALPFFLNTLIGSLFYSSAFFGIYALATKYKPALIKN